jgi:hypothetical protein
MRLYVAVVSLILLGVLLGWVAKSYFVWRADKIKKKAQREREIRISKLDVFEVPPDLAERSAKPRSRFPGPPSGSPPAA